MSYSPARLFKSGIMPNGITNMLFHLIPFHSDVMNYIQEGALFTAFSLQSRAHEVLVCPEYFTGCCMEQGDNRPYLLVVTYVII